MNRNYTVQEIRSTLGSIVSDIFTDAFAKKYHRFITKNGNNPDAVSSAMIDRPDNQINIMIGNLLFTRKYYPDNLPTLIESASDEILSGIYLRYYVVTQYLISLDPDSVMSLPDSQDDFFLELLINFWMEVCLHVPL